MGIVFDTILNRLRRGDSPASQAEMEAGTEAGARAMSPLAVAQAIAALSPTVGEGKPASGKTTPVDADTLQLWDSAASEAGKSLTWANAKATLALVFAGLTHASTHAADGDDPLAPADIGAATAAQGLLADTSLQDATAFEPAGAVLSHDGDEDAHADQIEAAIAAAGLGTGDVSGPASSTDGGLVAFSGITGKILKAGPAIGTTAGTVAAGDDARLSDARTPTAHATTHATGQTDALTAANIGAETAGAVTTHNGAAAAHPFSAADRYRYGGTAGTTTEGTITAAGRAILDDDDAAAQRGTLGAYRDQAPASAAEVSGADVAPDFAAALTLQWTLTGNVTSLATATNLASGETGEIIVTIGSYALPADPPSGAYKGAWTVTGTRVRIIVEQIGAAQYWTADSLEVVA